MKISEIFTRFGIQNYEFGIWNSKFQIPTSPSATSTTLTALLPPSGLNDGAGLETKLPLGDDGLSGPQSLLDNDFFVQALARRDWPLFDRRVRLDHKHVLALLAGLNRFAGYNGGLGQLGEMQADARELTGPQAAISIVDRRLQSDRVCCRVDKVVYERQPA